MKEATQADKRGKLETAFVNRVSGWATGSGRKAAMVEIYANDVLVAVVPARGKRMGLRDAGLHPTGLCGFMWKPGSEAELDEDAVVRARIVGQDVDLPGSPRKAGLPPGRRREEVEEEEQDPLDPNEAGFGEEEPVQRKGKRRKKFAKVAKDVAKPLDESAAASVMVDKTVARIATEEDVAKLPKIPQLPPAPRRRPLTIFLHSLWAFFLRELRSRYSEYRLGYLWAILQPLAYMLVLRGARSTVRGGSGRGDVYGVDFIYFLAIGMLPFFMWQHSFHRAMGAIASFRGMYTYRQLQPIDALLARILVEVSTMVALLTSLISVFWWTGRKIELEDPMLYCAAIGYLLALAIGIGLLADVYVTKDREVRQVFQMVERPLFFISGVFFVAGDLPPNIAKWLMWNPMLHAIDLGRGAMLTHYQSPCSWLYLSITSSAVLALGLGAYRRNLYELTQ